MTNLVSIQKADRPEIDCQNVLMGSIVQKLCGFLQLFLFRAINIHSIHGGNNKKVWTFLINFF